MCALITIALLVMLTIGGVWHGSAPGYIFAAFAAVGLGLAALSNRDPGETGRDPGHTGT